MAEFWEYRNVLPSTAVRVRIVKQPTGSVDGIELWKLIEGNLYDVRYLPRNFLLASRWAELVADERPALIVPLDDLAFQPPTIGHPR